MPYPAGRSGKLSPNMERRRWRRGRVRRAFRNGKSKRRGDAFGGFPWISGSNGGYLRVWLVHRIREVDGHDEEVADTLADLHRLTFFDGAPIPNFDWGNWWLAYHAAVPVGFAGLVPSTCAYNAGYFCRVGVLRRHCGHRLQLRLMRALELRARHNGWSWIVSDTTGNLASANNFIRAGYRLYQPRAPWAWPDTLYWRKPIK
jgi:GNAT superfamily N-acetyltransferase